MSDAESGGRIPSLDGLRAMCVIVVLIGHLELCLDLEISSSVAALFHVGKFAVRTFLAISGFLITAPLLVEWSKAGTLDLRRYYMRRTLRVFPAYYAFIGIMLLLRGLDVVSVPPYRDFAVAATYTTNYISHTWTFGHTWSLSVQEQFYLVWPLIILALGGRGALWFAGALWIVAPISRVLLLDGPLPEVRLDAYMDSLAAGCLLAGLRPRLLQWEGLNRVMKSSWAIILPVMISVGIQWMDRRPNVVAPWVLNLFLFTIQNVMIMIIIHWSITNAHQRIGQFLNCRTMTFIGAISYSIYLWQQPFLNPYSDALWTTFPLNLIGLTACAIASYYLVELPAFALRRRLAPKRQRRPPASTEPPASADPPAPAVPTVPPLGRRPVPALARV